MVSQLDLRLARSSFLESIYSKIKIVVRSLERAQTQTLRSRLRASHARVEIAEVHGSNPAGRTGMQGNFLSRLDAASAVTSPRLGSPLNTQSENGQRPEP